MQPRIIGENLLARDADGKLRTRIATIFPRANTIVTVPGIHATQRAAFVEELNKERAGRGIAPLTEWEEEDQWMQAVDLVQDDDAILIRPDPCDMDLAFEADELLQQVVSKKRIKFLYVRNPQVRDAIRRRGELWRVSSLPRSADEMMRMIASSKIRIGGRDLYYYNKANGMRFLTCQEFAGLAELPEAELRQHLIEIQHHSCHCNRIGNPEIAFFGVDDASLATEFAGNDFAAMDGNALRSAYDTLRQKFRDAVRPEFCRDDLHNPHWRGRMFAALIGQTDKAFSEEALLGLSAEFFMQVEWLPGGRFEDGELILDSVFDEEVSQPHLPLKERVCDEKTRGFVINFLRDFGDLDYVNIGCVVGSLSLRPGSLGRRGVYLAEVKQKFQDRPVLRIIRMQKWGVREHLDEGKDLLSAILESEQYTEYVLDRRLGCRQLGMNVSPQLTARKLDERYTGRNSSYHGAWMWSCYFERDYIAGLATDKIPASQFAEDDFALAFARLMGRAAAPNLIVGRCGLAGDVIFDDGDELVFEDESGIPTDIVVADHTGTFVDYRRDLRELAPAYAAPVRKRTAHVSNPVAFREAFLEGFAERFAQIQQEYRKRRRAFDTLFRHERRDEGGSFGYRWERVLARLNAANATELAEIIRKS